MGECRVLLVVSCVTVAGTNELFAADSVRLRVFMAALSSRSLRAAFSEGQQSLSESEMLMTKFTLLHAVLCCAVFISDACVCVCGFA